MSDEEKLCRRIISLRNKMDRLNDPKNKGLKTRLVKSIRKNQRNIIKLVEQMDVSQGALEVIAAPLLTAGMFDIYVGIVELRRRAAR